MDSGILFGDSVDTDWYYSAWITPFAEDAVVAWKKGSSQRSSQMKAGILPKSTVPEGRSMQVGELEQLALVLPKRDMKLIATPSLRGFSDSVWFDMPTETKWCEFMKWAEWEKYPKIACPLYSDLIAWKAMD